MDRRLELIGKKLKILYLKDYSRLLLSYKIVHFLYVSDTWNGLEFNLPPYNEGINKWRIFMVSGSFHSSKKDKWIHLNIALHQCFDQ